MDSFSDESDNEMYEIGVFDSGGIVDTENRRLYNRINYRSEFSDSEFTYRFRLNKTSVDELLLKITPSLKVISSRNKGISPLHQLLLTLRFYALGTMLLSVADFIGVSKASASRIVHHVSRAIAGLYPQYVKTLSNTQNAFHEIAGFPRILGAIDCTHVPIQSPDSNIGEEFRNRKGIFSMNVQGVCNADLLFMNVVARWPGSAHDATIFNNSTLKMQCEEGLFGNRWLIGDSAYPCTSYLLTPLLNATSVAENRYNEAHIKTRNTIERCFGVWKRRFPILSLKIRVATQTTQAIIIATSVLHNICRLNNIRDVDPEVAMPQESGDITYAEGIGQQNHSVRQQLINNYFSV
ncbi:unnamed protein product [Parnassius apollo]|uniref:(apollo) hypothetical protein n=1 Tax=Parnassius apollo TaxID=110799 RepID=A0A8S3X9W3_PARAO|nr:unnamed protein product [Parnassius apollo]